MSPSEATNAQFFALEKKISSIFGATDATRRQKYLEGINIHEWFKSFWSAGYDDPSLYDTSLAHDYADLLTQMEREKKNLSVLAPRGYLKTHLLGFGYLTYLAYTKKNRVVDFIYFCYSALASERRLREFKNQWSSNPKLAPLLDQTLDPTSATFRHSMGGKRIEIHKSSIKAFTRGEHVSGAIFCDDVLKDPENPLSPVEVEKVADVFFAEIQHLKDKRLYVPTVLFGTPMMEGDLFDIIKNDMDDMFISEKFQVSNMYPIPDTALKDGSLQVLCEQLQTRDLIFDQRNDPKFMQEMMCEYTSILDAFFTKEEIQRVMNPELRCLSIDEQYEKEKDEIVVAGADIGRKRHPTHISVFSVKDGRVKQIFQQFYVNMPYPDQVAIMNKVAKNFKVDFAKWDNTRTELQDRNLVKPWVPVAFTRQNKNAMASAFDFYVNGRDEHDRFKIELIDNAKQLSQLISVNKELKSMADANGHGDAFFSSALALWCLYELHVDLKVIGYHGDSDPKHRHRRLMTKYKTLQKTDDPEAYKEDLAEVADRIDALGYTAAPGEVYEGLEEFAF